MPFYSIEIQDSTSAKYITVYFNLSRFESIHGLITLSFSISVERLLKKKETVTKCTFSI